MPKHTKRYQSWRRKSVPQKSARVRYSRQLLAARGSEEMLKHVVVDTTDGSAPVAAL